VSPALYTEIDRLRGENEKLRKERDEARTLACTLAASSSQACGFDATPRSVCEKRWPDAADALFPPVCDIPTLEENDDARR
jgi:hypothetical protein